MARTNLTATVLAAGQSIADAAESAVAIDAANGMRIVPTGRRDVTLRITNTHGSVHPVTVPVVQGAGNPRGAYGAAGPTGSYPTEPDGLTTAIAATTGVRYVTVSARHFQTDGSVWLNFEAAHTGTIAAIEFA